jgi:serine/threonine protein kinase
VTHKTHVSTEFKWSGDDLEKSVDLSHKLGEGAFGTVYRAEVQGFEMAIKTVHAKSEEAIADVKHEMAFLQGCRNKYIVAYYGCWGPDSKKRLWILYASHSKPDVSD